MNELRIAPCSRKDAKYAVMRWHYSRRMPVFKLNCYGVWELGKFVGTVIFSLGSAGAANGTAYGLKRNFEVVELCRVALGPHTTPTSRIIAISLKLLKRHNPNLRMVISFADTTQGHHGGIYQANGWIYAGDYDSSGSTFVVHGKEIHPKTLHSRYGENGQSIGWLRTNVDPNAARVQGLPKHRYLYPLDTEIKQRIMKLAKPYPKRAGSAAGGTPSIQDGGGGSTPTPALSDTKNSGSASRKQVVLP